ncbi:hypothetical protein AA313_de0202678 [Arthrobotrys entomopaga]|nr:hypothetical protein AA313_de0202678 [Arthrobotrys entomopaga]
MRSFAILIPLFTAAASALHSHPRGQGQQHPIGGQQEIDPSKILGLDHTELRTIKLGPDVTKRVTEEGKWELKKAGVNFMDVTDHEEHYAATTEKIVYKYPSKPQHEDIIKPLLAKLDAENMKANLEKFTSFYTRYYRSQYGAESSRWLLSRVNETASGNPSVSVAPFIHKWGQNSIIAHIPPSDEEGAADISIESTSTKRIVIGAHQDSVNLLLPMFFRSPGADDDGSGTVTILEAFRVLVNAGIPLKNPVEFQWYSGEEGGLLGSQAIFSEYSKRGYKVGAMLQQDMTGFVKRTIDAGKQESVGVITDYVDAGLTDFIKKVITAYCDIPYVETKCGYACSDHASASQNGYQSAFVIESAFEYSDDKIHTTEDKIEHLSFKHMLQHAKLTLALALELGLADLE